MSYTSLDTSKQDGQPILLFDFVQGSTVWRYWAGNGQYAFNGHLYDPVPIEPSNFADTGDISKDPLSIKLPISNALAATFLLYTPDVTTSVTVYRTNYGDSNYRVAWRGRVLNYPTSIGTVTLNCESIFASMRRLGLRMPYQRLCPLALGDIDCQVDRAAYSAVYTVSSLAGIKVTFTASLAADYQGGLLKAPDGTSRLITDTGSNYVVLMWPMQSLADSMAAHPSGFTVTLYQGCDRSTKMCAERFNNLGRFRGWPGIQWINPMTNISSVF